jgi:5'-deoxynucleotidase YfbR-like HD superfamily hydrolase
MICIEDIAHALSLSCRYGGHTQSFYSVAQHCCLATCIADSLGLSNELQMCCLLHDASEAYVTDLPSPLKHMLPEFYTIEDRFHEVIFEKYSLPYPMPAEVKEIDLRLLVTEAPILLGELSDVWDTMLASAEPYAEGFIGDLLRTSLARPWSPDFAEAEYKNLFNMITDDLSPKAIA